MPSAPRSSATALPSPVPPPVMRAVFPVRSIGRFLTAFLRASRLRRSCLREFSRGSTPIPPAASLKNARQRPPDNPPGGQYIELHPAAALFPASAEQRGILTLEPRVVRLYVLLPV